MLRPVGWLEKKEEGKLTRNAGKKRMSLKCLGKLPHSRQQHGLSSIQEPCGRRPKSTRKPCQTSIGQEDNERMRRPGSACT